MKVIKALFLTLWVHSLLAWLYIVARVVLDHVQWNSLFIDAVPFLTFSRLAIITFVSSMISMFMYFTNGLESVRLRFRKQS
jgi:hypothetical protein